MPTKICARRLDELGRVVLPAEIRTKLNMQKCDYLDMCYENGIIMLMKNTEHTCCSSCKISNVPLAETGEIHICCDCTEKIKKL